MSLGKDSVANKVLQESHQDIVNLVNIDEIVSRLFGLKRITLSDFERLQNLNGNLTDQQRKLTLYITALAGKGQQGLDAFLKALDETADQYEPHALLADKLRAKLKIHNSLSGTPLSKRSTSSFSECNVMYNHSTCTCIVCPTA